MINTKLLKASGLCAAALFAVGTANATPVALNGSTNINMIGGSGFASGSVSTGHQIFDFNASAGDVVTIDIDVTNVLFEDDDSVLYLFNSAGNLIAENDDDAFGLQSLISNFEILFNDIYYIGVTTFNNMPDFDTFDIIDGWSDDGESAFEYDLSVTTAGSNAVPEPAALLLLGSGLAGLAFARRKKQS